MKLKKTEDIYIWVNEIQLMLMATQIENMKLAFEWKAEIFETNTKRQRQ